MSAPADAFSGASIGRGELASGGSSAAAGPTIAVTPSATASTNIVLGMGSSLNMCRRVRNHIASQADDGEEDEDVANDFGATSDGFIQTCRPSGGAS